MREILFRGKQVDNGKWVEGFYCPVCFGYFPCRPAIVSKEKIDSGCWQPQEVIPETVGQFTGLYDDTKWEELTDTEKKDFYDSVKSEDGITIKYESVEKVKRLWKGKKIFDGDIVKVKISDVFDDVFEDVIIVDFGNFSLMSNIEYSNEAKIIGNIQDSPKPFKGGESDED